MPVEAIRNDTWGRLCLMPEVVSINNTLGSCLINTLAGMQCKYY